MSTYSQTQSAKSLPKKGGYVVTPEAGEYVCFKVEDTGSGLDGETIGRIFDPFFSTKAQGRGLGLSAVLGIVKGHAAGLMVTNARNGGAVFEVYWPASELSAGVEDGASTGSNVEREYRHDGSKVLIADDEELIREMLGESLKWAGFEVITVSDGELALKAFNEDAANISAVVVDLSMPHMTGTSVIAKIRELGFAVPIILMSGYPEPESSSKLAEADGVTFMQKPFHPGALIAQLHDILAKTH